VLGAFFCVPAIAIVLIGGPLAAWIVADLKNAMVVSGLSAIGAGLYRMGIPRDCILAYEATIKAGQHLVVAHGTFAKAAKARNILSTLKLNPSDRSLFSNLPSSGDTLFNYKAASDKFTADPKSFSDCGHAYHTAVKAKDRIFRAYESVELRLRPTLSTPREGCPCCVALFSTWIPGLLQEVQPIAQQTAA
jgi:hypothetical protein